MPSIKVTLPSNRMPIQAFAVSDNGDIVVTAPGDKGEVYEYEITPQQALGLAMACIELTKRSMGSR